VAFLEEAGGRVPPELARVYAIAGDPGSHRAADVLPFMLAHPRRKMVFRPNCAARLNLVEPWWKVPRPLARAGRRFEPWDEVAAAVAQATAHWNAHRRIPSPGDGGAAIGRAASPASLSCPRPHDLPDEPLRSNKKSDQ
jgi:hypothetical protein